MFARFELRDSTAYFIYSMYCVESCAKCAFLAHKQFRLQHSESLSYLEHKP